MHLYPRDAVAFRRLPAAAPAGWPGCAAEPALHLRPGRATSPTSATTPSRPFTSAIKRVEPSADYTYDAIYRLIEATGREHLGQAGGAPDPPFLQRQAARRILFSASDGNAMGAYLQRYVYDAVGNFRR